MDYLREFNLLSRKHTDINKILDHIRHMHGIYNAEILATHQDVE